MRLDLIFVSVIFGGIAAWWLCSRWRIRRAQAWPSVQGTIELARVIHREPRSAPTFESHPRWACRLQFVYVVNGSYFSGDIEYVFSSESVASQFADRQRARPVVVHYKSSDPSIGILDENDLERLNRAATTAGKL